MYLDLVDNLAAQGRSCFSYQEFLGCCIYPSPEYLIGVLSADKYVDTPYTKELALGAGRLDYRCFDVSVLEYYRNDPRYHYDNNDIGEWICVRDQYLVEA